MLYPYIIILWFSRSDDVVGMEEGNDLRDGGAEEKRCTVIVVREELSPLAQRELLGLLRQKGWLIHNTIVYSPQQGINENPLGNRKYIGRMIYRS